MTKHKNANNFNTIITRLRTEQDEQLLKRLTEELQKYDQLLRKLPDREGIFEREKWILHTMYLSLIKFIKDAMEALEKSDITRVGWETYNNEIKLDALIGFAETLEEIISGGAFPKTLREAETWLEKYRIVEAANLEVAATRDD